MFGILSALGIASALLLSLSLAPAILVVASTPREKTLKRHSGGLYSRTLKGLGSFTIKNKLTIVLISISIVAVSAVKIPEVRFETNTVNNFKKKTEIRQSTEFLNKNFSGITVMKIVVKAKNRGGIYDPYLLSKIDDLQNYLENLRLYRDRVI